MIMHHINAALRAHTLFHRDVDYIVQNGEVVIVDEHTGRTMPGVVGQMVYIKQLKRKKTLKSVKKIKHSHPLLSKIISVFIKNSLA